MIAAIPTLEPYDVPRAALWGVGECQLAQGIVDMPLTAEDVERDAAWMTRMLGTYGLQPGDVVVLVVGPVEAGWAHSMLVAISRIGGVAAYAWAARFDARRVGALARNLKARMIIGIDAAVVDGLADLPAGIVGEIGAVPHILARADAHPALEKAGLRPALFDLVGPAVVMEPADRRGAHFDDDEWQIVERDGGLEITTVGRRALQVTGAATGRRGTVRSVDGSGERVVLDRLIR